METQEISLSLSPIFYLDTEFHLLGIGSNWTRVESRNDEYTPQNTPTALNPPVSQMYKSVGPASGKFPCLPTTSRYFLTCQTLLVNYSTTTLTISNLISHPVVFMKALLNLSPLPLTCLNVTKNDVLCPVNLHVVLNRQRPASEPKTLAIPFTSL